MSPVSEAQKRANEKYTKANYDEIKVRVPKGKKKIIQQCALNVGESTTAFINRAIDERIERENPLPEAPAASNIKEPEPPKERSDMVSHPEAPIHETPDAKLERLRREHSTQAPTSSNE